MDIRQRDRLVEACISVLRDVQAGVSLVTALHWQRVRGAVPLKIWTEFEELVRKALAASRTTKGVRG